MPPDEACDDPFYDLYVPIGPRPIDEEDVPNTDSDEDGCSDVDIV